MEQDIARLGVATGRLDETVAALPEAALSEPSLLPGWTRAHVLTHLARNADGMRNLLLSARSGKPVGLYASRAVRDADIEAGSSRPPDVIGDDLRVASQRLAFEIDAMPVEAWSSVVEMAPGTGKSPSFRASSVITFRLFELEVHHVDLAAAYGYADVPPELVGGFVERSIGLLGDRAPSARLEATDSIASWDLGAGEPATVVAGPAPQLLGWLLGRSDGSGLQTPDGAGVPTIPTLT